jgi:methionyl-tRNA formyltransferase
MRVAIFGTDDAVAHFGQRLAHAGHDVVQVAPADLASTGPAAMARLS